MAERHIRWPHPLMRLPKAGEREIRARPPRPLPLARGGDRFDAGE